MSGISGLRRIGAFALALGAAGLSAGCAGSGPRDTNFTWKLASDRPVHHTRLVQTGTQTHKAVLQEARVVPRLKPDADDEKFVSWQPDQPVAEHASFVPDAGTRFEWPLRGRIIEDFGATANGGRNDGINIAAITGMPIRAAADGKVTYTGNAIKGYGNLVLIQHDDGYVTAYAHAARIAVDRGDRVEKGQIIAYAGDTGDVSEPQLHFEIRHGIAPVNPRTLLVARE
jgi:murein DD-endopeptidase MepM/ murein hydrolase activator NlpD